MRCRNRIRRALLKYCPRAFKSFRGECAKGGRGGGTPMSISTIQSQVEQHLKCNCKWKSFESLESFESFGSFGLLGSFRGGVMLIESSFYFFSFLFFCMPNAHSLLYTTNHMAGTCFWLAWQGEGEGGGGTLINDYTTVNVCLKNN